MKKEKKPLPANDLDQTNKADFKKVINNLKPLENKYKDLSLSELKELFNNADLKKIDKDLEMITDLLIGLTESIHICQLTSPNTDFYRHHASKIKHLNDTLKDFAWFEELKKRHSELFSCDNLQIE